MISVEIGSDPVYTLRSVSEEVDPTQNVSETKIQYSRNEGIYSNYSCFSYFVLY